MYKISNVKSIGRRIIASVVLVAFVMTGVVAPVRTAYAQEMIQLPEPGTRINLSSSFAPPLLKGVKVYPDNPFKLDFILDKGDSNDSTEDLKGESTRLIKYFLASITVPEKDLWVNLSPYEKDRIIPDGFGVTEMGRDLLAQDYMLKQITASVIYPEEKIGKEFWDKVYTEAQRRFGSTDVPVDTFNKVWIVPEKAVVYENKDSAYVVDSHLKVLLEEDYLALEKGTADKGLGSETKETNKLGAEIVREVVIPILEKEINEGKNFSQLRQVYQSLILAIWFKDKIKESIFGQAYVDQGKVSGVDIEDKAAKDKIWAQYVEAFKKGSYNYIKEDVDPVTQQTVPRKYFSGGAGLFKTRGILVKSHDRAQLPLGISDRAMVVAADLLSVDSSMKQGKAFDAELDAIAKSKGVELGPNTKIGLFVGGPHIQNGYYYDMFNTVVRQRAGYDLVYLPYPISEGAADQVAFIERQIENNSRILGAVITRPWKEAFFKPGNNEIGAVNFIVKQSGDQQLVRSAVDGTAWLRGLEHDLGKAYDFRGKRIVIVGSGGAARELAETLSGKGVDTLTLVDVNEEKLNGLGVMLDRLKPDYKVSLKSNSEKDNVEALDRIISDADVIVNATGVGRKDTLDQSPLPSHKGFHKGQVVSDLISDTETKFLMEARGHGAEAVYTGRSMFVYGMVMFMRGWMEQLQTGSQALPSEDQLFRNISQWLDQYALLGDPKQGILPKNVMMRDAGGEHQVDIQIPRWMDLNETVRQVSFVFDVDKTLTATGVAPISEDNLSQIVRAIKLRQTQPDLKIKFILISGSGYKRFVTSRFARRISNLNWEAIKANQAANGVSPEVVEEVRAEIQEYLRETGQSAEDVGCFLNVTASIEQRAVKVIMDRLNKEGISLDAEAIQVISATGGEKARYDPEKGKFIYQKNDARLFEDQEQLEASRALAVSYLTLLAQKTGRNFSTEIERLLEAKTFINAGGIFETFEGATFGMGVEMLPFDHETHIVFNNPQFAVDGVLLAQKAMENFKKTAGFNPQRIYYPKGGSNFGIISLVDKSDEIEQRVAKNEIIVGGGDSTTDSFLWDSRFADQMLPMFFGRKQDVMQHSGVIVARDGGDHDTVFDKGSLHIMKSTLDAMERKLPWGDVAFLNNRYSPRQIAASKEVQPVPKDRAMITEIAGRVSSEFDFIENQVVGDSINETTKFRERILTDIKDISKIMQERNLQTLIGTGIDAFSESSVKVDNMDLYVQVSTYDPPHWGHLSTLTSSIAEGADKDSEGTVLLGVMMPNGWNSPDLSGGHSWKQKRSLDYIRFRAATAMADIFWPLIDVTSIGRRLYNNGSDNAFILVKELSKRISKKLRFTLVMGADNFNQWGHTYLEYFRRYKQPNVEYQIYIANHYCPDIS